MSVLNKVGKATTDLIRKVIREGMETERMDMTEQVYKYNEYKILGVSWSQSVAEGGDPVLPFFIF